MAFNFNWSPLTADADFYTRAQELLTTALNKSPKPPIIVDDILVNELNLGTTPPDLEILEIGDLAEDRFRGIFKMCYNGDAFVTLKTRVQANPLNTYLSTRPTFTSPQPVAAASGLTIPIQITLSEFKLSAFIILVFSKQKGITLVFRNDPLESMKVSSTFDAIPFVRDYLQRVIESQLRSLLMDELPLIIHRLSLRLFVPEYKEKEDRELAQRGKASTIGEKPVDPLASPPQDPVDATGNPLDQNEIAALSLDSSSEMHALFSQKNILRLSALTDSHKTLSLFTPSIRDAVFRAWTGPTEREGPSNSGKATPATAPTLIRAHTFNGSNSTTYTFTDNKERPPLSSRQSLSTLGSTAASLGLGSKSSKPKGRKRKHRVVNLRKKASTAAEGEELESISGDSNTNSETLSSTQSDPLAQPRTPDRNAGELTTPPSSPEQSMKEPGDADIGLTPPRYRDATRDITPRPHLNTKRLENDFDRTPRQSQYLSKDQNRPSLRASQSFQHLQNPSSSAKQSPSKAPSYPALSQSPGFMDPPQRTLSPSPFVQDPPAATSSAAQPTDSSTNDEAQTAWMTKMVSMIAQKVQDQKAADSGFWDRPASMMQQQQQQPRHADEEEPPPAYST